MSAPRRPSYTEQLERTVAELLREKEISDRLRAVAEREIATLRAKLQQLPVQKLVLKKAGFVYGLTEKHELENIRKAIEAKNVKAEKIRGQWVVDMSSLADFVKTGALRIRADTRPREK
jgi:hypothetical protein